MCIRDSDRVIAHSATDAEETGTYHHSRNKETADYLHQVHIVLRQKEELSLIHI